MKLKYLGTAAAEGIPALFCECRVCKQARKLGGKDIKTRSQALVDGKILIDFPGDTYMHSLKNNIRLSEIRSCLVTHSHFDHLYPDEIWCRCRGIANDIEENKPLVFYGATAAYEKLSTVVEERELEKTGRVLAKHITPFEPFVVEGYTVTPLKASHDPKSTPVVYIIEKDGKTMFYAHDTGFFCEETANYLKACGKHFDLVSLDCTNGLLDIAPGSHMGLAADIKIKEMLVEWGLCDNMTKFVVNHFSHNGNATHDELDAQASKHGFITSYDGLEIEF